MGNSHPNIAPYSVYRTRDNDYIVIGVATDSQFEKLCEILGMDTSREDFKLNKGRCAQRDRLNADIQDILLARWDLKDLIREMTARAIPFSEIKSVKQLFEDPEIQQMHLTERVESQKFSKEYLEYPKNPVRYSKTELAEFKEPPLLGEDTEKILKGILGYTDDTIA